MRPKKEYAMNSEKTEPCPTCPYRRSSPPGYTSYQESQRGHLESLSGILEHIRNGKPQICHTSVINYEKPAKRCRGFTVFMNGGDENFLGSVDDLKSHHVTQAGAPPSARLPKGALLG